MGSRTERAGAPEEWFVQGDAIPGEGGGAVATAAGEIQRAARHAHRSVWRANDDSDTPAIIGPGIEEEYADALERVEKLEILLKAFSPSNDTPEGRMVYQLMWLRQEIQAKRLPIPLERKYWATLGYQVGEGAIDYLGGAKFMAELARILKGVGLLKRRHHPVIVAMLDDFLDFVKQAPRLNATEQKLIEEAREIRTQLAAGAIELPLDESRYPGWRSVMETTNLDELPNFGNRQRSLALPIFEEWRPSPARKGPLPAPNPGMVWGGP